MRQTFALTLAALVIAGCGGTSYEGEAARVDATVKAFDASQRAGHGAAICRELFTPRLRHALAGTLAYCAQQENRPLKLTSIANVKVNGHRATADIETADQSKATMHLVETAGRWRIDTINFTSLGS